MESQEASVVLCENDLGRLEDGMQTGQLMYKRNLRVGMANISEMTLPGFLKSKKRREKKYFQSCNILLV